MNILRKLPLEPTRIIESYLFESLIDQRRCFTVTAKTSESSKTYSKTLLLPTSSLPTKHKDPAAVERRLRSRTTTELYRWQAKNRPEPTFVLHDGPPYANGRLHMGHALNKILKDVINRYKLLRGHRIHYIPGWDCHGLPIEQKALELQNRKHNRIDPLEIRRLAKAEALRAIEVQKQEFIDLGIMAEWDSPEGTYRTLDHDFELRELELFRNLVKKELVTFRKRPTYFSPASGTALAESELKYRDDHRSTSVYVAFDVYPDNMSPGLRAVFEEIRQQSPNVSRVRLVVWTTTPWSLPGNAGVAVNEDALYGVTKGSTGELLLLMADRIPALEEKLGGMTLIRTMTGAEILGTAYSHPFQRNPSNLPIVFHSENVNNTSGTGLVHSAPAHGHDDYNDFQAAGILPEELRSPIDDEGRFTSQLEEWADPEAVRPLIGASVLYEATGLMINFLDSQSCLLAQETYVHKYPYDWKTDTPVIVRATSQWFIELKHLKDTALKSLDMTTFVPTQSRQRLEAFLDSRSEWCISRQRSWGLPIPVIFDQEGVPVLEPETMNHILEVFQRRGSDHWWTGPMEDFVPAHLADGEYVRGKDTLDVWFDSGSTWTMLKNLERTSSFADVCLEGSDQHRGWFQSLLFTSVAITEGKTIPYTSLVTHGFILDEKGAKMSKSAGNGLSPSEIVNGATNQPALGADTLRLWAASVDYQKDVTLGKSSLAHATESLRRLRNIGRFMVGVTAGSQTILEKTELNMLDRFLLHELSVVEEGAISAYDSLSFNRALNIVMSFATSTLSTVYFDIIKDSLYCDAVDAPRRTAIIAVLRQILDTLLKMIAPLAPHLAEELHEARGHADRSVFMNTWAPRPQLDTVASEIMFPLLEVRSAVLSLTDQARKAGHVGRQNEASLFIEGLGGNAERNLATLQTLAEIFPVSSVIVGQVPCGLTCFAHRQIVIGAETYQLRLAPAGSHRCPRCWRFQSDEKEHLCSRCGKVLG